MSTKSRELNLITLRSQGTGAVRLISEGNAQNALWERVFELDAIPDEMLAGFLTPFFFFFFITLKPRVE